MEKEGAEREGCLQFRDDQLLSSPGLHRRWDLGLFRILGFQASTSRCRPSIPSTHTSRGNSVPDPQHLVLPFELDVSVCSLHLASFAPSGSVRITHMALQVVIVFL